MGRQFHVALMVERQQDETLFLNPRQMRCWSVLTLMSAVHMIPSSASCSSQHQPDICLVPD